MLSPPLLPLPLLLLVLLLLLLPTPPPPLMLLVPLLLPLPPPLNGRSNVGGGDLPGRRDVGTTDHGGLLNNDAELI